MFALGEKIPCVSQTSKEETGEVSMYSEMHLQIRAKDLKSLCDGDRGEQGPGIEYRPQESYNNG